MQIKTTLLLILLFISNIAFSQIVNIENSRINQDSNGFAGSIDATYYLIQNSSQVMSFGSNLNMQFKHNKHLMLALSNISFVKAGGENFDNKGFQHIRYNYNLNPIFTLEAFTQAQYNKLVKVDLRYLLGGGIRIKPIDRDSIKLNLGVSGMYDYEEIREYDQFNRDFRLSSYLTFYIDINKMLSFRATSYYQPLAKDFTDYRITLQSQLNIKLNEKIKFYTNFNLAYDSQPPLDVINLSYTMRNGLIFSFHSK